MFEIRRDDLSGEATRALLSLHLAGMRASSPPESVFALDLSGLLSPGIVVWTVRDNGTVVGIGALRALPDNTGELKSMRTHPDHLRRGVASALLDRLIAEARGLGLTALRLETGSGPAFEPALSLYRSRGFVDGGPFGDYERSRFNRFLHLPLD